MIAIPSGVSIFLCTTATDMRKSFDGLTGLVRSEFSREPNDGSLFLFINRRRDRIKILYWEAGGFALWYKNLEAHYPHFFLFTESGDDADNFACRPASAG